tara:strand:- start:520 stop:960 length:441 start_codon:yes stop_codon:yes gene_type:complete
LAKDGSLAVDDVLSWGAGNRTAKAYVDGPEVEWHKLFDDAPHNDDWQHRLNDEIVANLHFNEGYERWELEINAEVGNTIVSISKMDTRDIPQSRYKDALMWANRNLIAWGLHGEAVDILADLYSQRADLVKGPEAYEDEYSVGGDF